MGNLTIKTSSAVLRPGVVVLAICLVIGFVGGWATATASLSSGSAPAASP
jgi:hypothetical protein